MAFMEDEDSIAWGKAKADDLVKGPYFTEGLSLSTLADYAEDLRDAIRLIVGMEKGIPWHEVDQKVVAGYVKRIRELKQG